MKLTGLQFQNCLSIEIGGAIYVQDRSVLIQSCAFLNNLATISGGTLAQSDEFVRLENVSFKGNVATGMMATNGGGAIVNLGGMLEVSFCRFSDNRANSAAILNLDGGSLMITIIEITSMSQNSVGAAPGNGGDGCF